MAKQFRLQVFTQEKKVVDENVTSVVLPGEDGYFGLLADHSPLIASLGQGMVTIRTDNHERQVQIGGGFCEVSNNTATILADSLKA